VWVDEDKENDEVDRKKYYSKSKIVLRVVGRYGRYLIVEALQEIFFVLEDEEEVEWSKDGRQRSKGEAQEDEAAEAELVHHKKGDVHFRPDPWSRRHTCIEVVHSGHRHEVRKL